MYHFREVFISFGFGSRNIDNGLDTRPPQRLWEATVWVYLYIGLYFCCKLDIISTFWLGSPASPYQKVQNTLNFLLQKGYTLYQFAVTSTVITGVEVTAPRKKKFTTQIITGASAVKTCHVKHHLKTVETAQCLAYCHPQMAR